MEYSTNLHKITLNAGTSYNMKRRGDLRNDLAISIVRANDSCDDQRFISGSGDFIQYDAEDENDGSEFTPVAALLSAKYQERYRHRHRNR